MIESIICFIQILMFVCIIVLCFYVREIDKDMDFLFDRFSHHLDRDIDFLNRVIHFKDSNDESKIS